MLKFILGRASSGKSYEICRQISVCVNAGGSPVLIIPEQFSFESEKRILSLLGDKKAQKVKVLSFSRLCDEVENISGGSAAPQMSDSDKIILMTSALKNVRSDLKCFGRYASSSGFCKMMINTVDEFIQNAVYPQDVFVAADDLDDGVFARKVSDTALIFSEYNKLLSEKLNGFEDKLTRLYNTLEYVDFFKDKYVFIDSFSGFTGQQYRIIDRILSGAKEVVVSLCDNTKYEGRFDIFANIKKAKSRISSLALKNGVKIEEDTVLASGRFVKPGVAAVEEYMCNGRVGFCPDSNEALICQAKTEYDEAQFVARNIRRIVRDTGAKFGEFVVIARNAADYEQVISTAFEKNGIPGFIDKRLPLYSLPPAALVKAAMELCKSVTTERILRFHKCGVEFLNREELSKLENYVYIWNIDGDLWEKDWNMDPQGISGGKMSENEVKGFLSEINDLRKRALAPVIRFSEKFSGGSYNMAKAVVELLESAREYFLDISNGYKEDNSVLSDAIVTSYSKIMSILNSLVSCLPQSASIREFSDAFNTCIDIETVGVIPQMIDEVLFGSADRIQPARPSYVFILGANQGVFPRVPQTSGVFAVSEIGKLINLGIDIPDCSVYSAIDEDLLVYNCVCCADKGVFISYSKRLGEPAYFVKRLSDKLGVETVTEPAELSYSNLPETADSAFSFFCRSEKYSRDYYTLKAALDKNGEFKDRVSFICDNYERPGFNIPSELSQKLLGRRIKLSPSRFDTYSKCPFMYFCKYALSVKSTEPVSLTAMQTGTLIHYVLQKFIEETSERIAELETGEIHAIVEKYINAYLDSFKGYRETETPHLKLMVSQMTETLKYLCERLALEFSQSEFKPEKCELIIGKDGDIKPVVLSVDDDVSVEVTGAVDRLDRYAGYVRIIDYKSGTRDFKLPDVLVGQNMQMLIYLYAVCGSKAYGGKPAGVFYMHAAIPENNTPAGRRMNGFMPEIPELITAMDKSESGEFIPQSSSRNLKTNATVGDFEDIFKFIELKLKQAGRNISSGRFAASPVDGRDKKACEYCEFASVCRIEDEKPERAKSLKSSEVLSEIKRQVSEIGV